MTATDGPGSGPGTSALCIAATLCQLQKIHGCGQKLAGDQ